MNTISRKPNVTYGLIVINVIVFLLMTLNGGSTSPRVLIMFGAKVNSLILAGQWWRFVTPMFLHIGFEHILLNMITLYFIGTQIEMFFGSTRFSLIYLISGIGGNIASFTFNPTALSAGASTALFGLFGAFLMLGESFRENPYIKAMARQFLLLVILNILFSFSGNIDLAGHLGGLAAGFLAAYIVGVPKIGKVPFLKRLFSLVALIFIGGLLLIMGFKI
ncbi:rhomboid family intramembrane serine protease [Liquorilactobacillus capillatus]|uniref:Rhomboid family integral membrane protein n=1 Tax=Liquorilactobacillus capillatus DSM 19910 TaxID=1423731 RepID=A0A0R1M560_9LACO|nr:rhomboid family intramembrane serine protease [Liquorilactobacillus capillatus]KRL03232.1 rhomboid family integral membrane protein [Liquorilactobacillus capillatus DSM 19910]